MFSCLKEPFIDLDEIKSKFDRYIPKPSVYGNSPVDTVIISTSSHENNSIPGIYEFNVNTNKMSLIYKYDKKFLIEAHGQFIMNDNLYLLGRSYESHSFNLKTKTMQRNTGRFCECAVRYPITNYIPSPINQIHITDSTHHFIYKIDDKNNISLLNSQMLDIDYPKSIFIPFKNQLMIFGGDGTNNIFYYNIDENINKNDELVKWEKYSLTMPYVVNDTEYDILLSFNTLLFIFYFRKRDIWCLDLQNNILAKSKYNMPDVESTFCENCNVLPTKDKNNNIHIINFEEGVHYKILLNELIPDDIQKYASKQYNLLIIGYIKKLENDMTIPTIPFVLKQLIFCYFPLFV